jgi:VWFA-related protein
MQVQLLPHQGLVARLRVAFESVSRFKQIAVPLIALMLHAVMPVCAQQAAETDRTGTISANAELVLVPVQVGDSSGKPLPRLHQDDFVLRSDGKVQPIKIFEESGRLSAESNTAAKPATPLATIGEEFSDVPDGGMPQQLLIIAIDRVNTPYSEQGWARQALLKYFWKGVPEQPFALVEITEDGIVQIHSFSSDPKALLDAIGHDHLKMSKAEQKHEVRGEIAIPCGLCPSDTARFKGTVETKAINATVLNFVQLEQAYAGVPGRKSLIWLSADMPDVEEIAAILDRGNIALYPVNLRGMQADTHLLGEDDDTHTGSSETPSGDNGMRELASRTGGRYCSAMTELKTCIGQAVADSTNYYLLGFYVAQQDRKPGWHKLKVQLTSNRGKVHARSGYYLEPRNASGEGEMLSDLIEAANAQIAYTGIAFSVQRLSESIGSPTAPIGFRIRVPATSVLLQSGQRNLSYEIAMVALSQKGEPTAESQTIRLDLNAEQTEHALTQGWRYDETLPKSGSAAVKFIIRDNGTGNIGSLVVPLTNGPNNETWPSKN